MEVRTCLINIPDCVLERFSFSARRDEEIVVYTTMTRSNEAMEENRQNPQGCASEIFMRQVLITNCTKQSVDGRVIKRAIFETLKILKADNGVKLSVVLVGDKKMRSLNKDWRNKDSVTDVLSFSFSEARDGLIEGGERGEIIICLPYAKKQARQLGISEKKNIALLSVHGTIHIFGIDHERSEKESGKTDKIQNKVLEVLRI